MRAAVLHGAGDLRIEEVPDPEPGPGELVLEVEAALTCATDTKMMRSGAHPALGPLPAPLGHECCGRIVAVGAGVEKSLAGAVVPANSAPCDQCRSCRRGRPSLCRDPVYFTGSFARFVRVPARIVRRNLLPVPDDLAAELAAMAEPLACAVRGAARSRAAAGDTVLILGGGPQGAFLAHLLAARGCRAILADPHPSRRERATRFGADEVLDAPRDPGSLDAALAATPDGLGADVVFAAVGSPEAWEQAVMLVRPGGEVNLHGGCPPGEMLSIDPARLHYDEITLQGSYHHTPEALRDALSLLASGRMPAAELLAPPVSLEELPEALARGGDKRAVGPLS